MMSLGLAALFWPHRSSPFGAAHRGGRILPQTQAIPTSASEPRIPGRTSQRVAEFGRKLGLQTYGFLREVTLDSFMPDGAGAPKGGRQEMRAPLEKFDKDTVKGIAAKNARHPSYLEEAEAVLDEWLGEAINDGNCKAAEAFGLAIHLIRGRMQGLGRVK